MLLKFPLLTVVSTCLLLFASTASAEMPEHVRDALTKLVGDWKITTTIGDETIEWELSCNWSPTKDAIVYSWEGPDYVTQEPNTGTGIIGWDAAKQMAVEFETEGNGTVFTATHYISEKGEWTSPTKATGVTKDGTVYVEVQRTLLFEGDDVLIIHGKHRIINGKKVPDERSVFKRK